jgi:ketosteroid isomerase-like protein
MTGADDLARRVQRLEDVERICDLKAAYCAACDDDHDGEAVAALFVDEGTWGTTLGADCRSPAEIRRHFGQIRASGRMQYSTHMVTNPVVEVSGDSAVGSWSFAMMYTDPAGRRFRILGFYRDEFTRTDDGWRFRSLWSRVQDYVQLDHVDDHNVAP